MVVDTEGEVRITKELFYRLSERRRRISVDIDYKYVCIICGDYPLDNLQKARKHLTIHHGIDATKGRVVRKYTKRRHISRIRALKTYFTLKWGFPNSKASMQETRHGHHVKIVGDEIEKYPIKKRVFIREQLGDDSHRLNYDYLKLKLGEKMLVDTLFSMKKDYDGKISIVSPMNPIALPFAPRLPAKKPHSRIFRALS